MKPTIATFGRSESTNTTLTLGPRGTFTTLNLSNWKVASMPVGQPAGGGVRKQIVRPGMRTTPPTSESPIGVSRTGVTGVMSPGSMIVGDADGFALSPGAGDDPPPPPPPCGIGSTSGPTTSGGTPPGGKPHMAGIRPPPNAVPNASTTDAGHQSPSYPECGRPIGSMT